jgi:hypothetical protein
MFLIQKRTKTMNEFKLIIAGGRDFNDAKLLEEVMGDVLNELPSDASVSIVSGMAIGADTLGLAYANKYGVKTYRFYPRWKEYGKRAEFLRNQEMCNIAHGLLAFHDGISKDTKHMITIARNKGIYVKVVPYVNETNKAINYE